jgi:phage terminase large subunit-like protein
MDRVRRLPRVTRGALYQRLRALGPGALGTRRFDWQTFMARPDQLVTPEELNGVRLLVFTGHRGEGKTEAAIRLFNGEIYAGRAKDPRIMAATEADVGGVLAKRIKAALPPHLWPDWIPSSKEAPAGLFVYRNGVRVPCFVAAAPEGTVSSEGDLDLYDDLAKWGPHAPKAWRHARLSCRKGRGLGIVATTRRGTALLRKLLGENMDGVLVRRPPTKRANAGNLTPGHYEQMARELGGDRFFDEEMEDLDLAEGSPFAGFDFDAPPIRLASCARGELVEVGVFVDPALTSGPQSDEWGIVVLGRRRDGHVVVLEDVSDVLDDDHAGERIVLACERWAADVWLAETNRGKSRAITVANAAWQKRRGDALEASRTTPRALPPFVPVNTREDLGSLAGNVSTLYRCGQLHHLAGLGKLEAQQLAWEPAAPPKPRVDDRIKGLQLGVYHLKGLTLADAGAPERLAQETRAAFVGLTEAQRNMPRPAFQGRRV